MQIVFQLILAFYFLMEGPWDPILVTLLSIVLTLSGAVAHRNIYREIKAEAKESQSEAKVRKLRWLNISAFFLVAAFPTLVVQAIPFSFSDRMSITTNTWFVVLCMNLPGIIYFVQAVSVGRTSGNKWKWPRYL